ncbi:MAG: ATP-binding protein [Campylobacterota bacterium]|nr:ATP-binding protein [Campylobacterota bacterium]
MKWFIKIFSYLSIFSLFIILLSVIFFNSQLKKISRQEGIRNLNNTCLLVKGIVKNSKVDEKLHKKIANFSRQSAMRITIIRKDGVVLDDSFLKLSEVKNIENHINRPEIILALKNGRGFSERFSHTLKRDMMYLAVYDGDKIIRVAYPKIFIASINNVFMNQAIFFFVVLIIFSFAVSYVFANRLAPPSREMEKIIEDIENSRVPVFPDFKNRTLKKIFLGIRKIYDLLKEKEKNLIEEREKLATVLFNMRQGIILSDEKGFVNLYNPAAEKLLKQKLKNNFNVFEDWKNYTLITFFGDIYKKSKFGKVLDVDKKRFLFNVADLNGKKLTVITDISKEEAYQKMKSRFFADASHELKTPITSILGYAETLLDNPDIDKATKKKFLNYIYKNAVSLNELVEDILELHRIEQTKRPIGKKTDIKEIVEELKTIFIKQAENKNLKFMVDYEEIIVPFAQEHVKSILWNLIDNAIKYTEKGHIRVLCQKKDKFFIIVIEDTGKGIEERHKQRIFERFYTAEEGRTKRTGGTGLGLAIVKHIIQLYDGEIDLKTEANKGSCFTVKLSLTLNNEG